MPCRILALILLLVSGAWGQLYTGSISGVVTDPSGAVIPDAKVTVTDVNRNTPFTTVSDRSGRYVLNSLPPSNYVLTVSVTGFNSYEQRNITVNINQNLTLDVSLQVGTTGTQVQVVDSQGPLMQTEDATTGQTLNRVYINDLPLIGRQVFDLAFLAPGVSQPPGSAYGNQSTATSNNFVSNGGRNGQADILIDGVSTTNYEQNTGFTVPLYTPGVDEVQEFRLQQSNFSAEIGFSGGSVINVVTRSGSNAFHGSAFEFLRNEDFNANGFFNNANGSPRQAYRWNDFGGTFGGPIIKNRVFFFFNYEGKRQSSPASSTLAVPSAAERAGNFGELCTRNGGSFNSAGLCSVQAGQLYDPYTATYNAATGSALRTSIIPFNNIATYASPGNPLAPWVTPNRAGNLIDPVASKVLNLLPLPNINVGSSLYDPYHNYFGTATNTNTGDQVDTKIDWRITDKDQLSVKAAKGWTSGVGGNIFGSLIDAGTQGPNAGLVYNTALNYTHTFGPKTLFTGSFGYTHSWSHTQGPLPSNFTPSSLGLPSYLSTSGFPAITAYQLGGGYPSENGNATYGTQPWSGLLYGSDVYHAIGSVSHIFGGHDVRIGGEFRVHRINFTQYGLPAGLLHFDQSGTSNSQYNSGDALASFLVGSGSGWGAYEIPPSPATENFQFSGFVQDNWKVTSKLTLNLGLRYDVDMPRTERYNRMTYFDPSAPSPLASVSSPDCPACGALHGALEFVGVNGNPRSPYDTYWGAVGPRFGFAYQALDKTVIRGGYGIYYDPAKSGAAGAGSGSMGFYGFSQQTSTTFVNPADNVTPYATPQNPYPQGILQPTGSSVGTLANLGNGFSGSAPIRNYNTLPQEQSWSFGIQRELPWGVLVDAEYVGKKGTHLYLGGDVNQLDHLPANIADQYRANPTYWNTYINNPLVAPATALSASNPTQFPAYSGPIFAATVPRWSLQLPYPQYPNGVWGANGLQNVDPPIGNSIYHSFQLRIEKRFSQGIQFLATYTMQKSIDDSSIAGSNVYIDGYSGATLAQIQDPNNLRLERSLSQFDISQIAQFSWVYQLPYGRGKHFGSNANKIVEGALGGWQINGIYRWDTGLPIILGLNGGVNIPTYGGQRPNLTSAIHKADGTNILQYFANPQVAVIPAPYTDGNAPRVLPNVRAPGTNNVSASLFKEFPLGFREGARLEFRAEAFNLLNRVQFASPDATVGDATFGKITSQANSPRTGQLALKLYF